jgi:protein phosphatase 1 regulatory subunit 7
LFNSVSALSTLIFGVYSGGFPFFSVKIRSKKMRIVVIICGLLLVFASKATELSQLVVNDKALDACIKQHAQQHNWQDTAEFTELVCHAMGIKEAPELGHFSALNKLSLFNNALQHLDLRALTQLTELNIANNQLTSLNIAGLSQLQTVYLFRNQLSTLDLSGLSKVTTIRLMQNQLTSLDISPLIALQKGYFFDNKLEDLQITGLDKLELLDVRQNPMPDVLYDFYDEQEGIVISHDGNADDWK